jgi:hypothetical protein
MPDPTLEAQLMEVLTTLREQLIQCSSFLELLKSTGFAAASGQSCRSMVGAEIKTELERLRRIMEHAEQHMNQLALALSFPAETCPTQFIKAVPDTFRPALKALMEENTERLRQMQCGIERARISVRVGGVQEGV